MKKELISRPRCLCCLKQCAVLHLDEHMFIKLSSFYSETKLGDYFSFGMIESEEEIWKSKQILFETIFSNQL